MNDTRVSMELDTDFPRSGHVRVRTSAENGASFSLALRIPEYAENFELLVNGARTSGKIEKGFLYLNALSGDTELEIDFAMSPHFVRADPRVRSARSQSYEALRYTAWRAATMEVSLPTCLWIVPRA